jgi:hypothetical protein
MIPRLHAGDVELAIEKYFGCRGKMIVPNVSWGLNFFYELDMLVVTQSGYGYEVEIKVSKADLKADQKKKHNHDSNRIRYLYFAVPEELQEDALELIPERAGLFVIRKLKYEGYRAKVVRSPKVNSNARKLTDEEIMKLGHLASMRIWSLKKHMYRYQRDYQKVCSMLDKVRS